MRDLFSRSLDDLAPGLRFSTRGRTVTEADVVGFATLSGDFHPQHTDAAWAADSPFGERIAHGLLVLSYAAGLVPFDPDRIMALRRVRDVVFKRPVRFGDTIRVEGRLATVDEVTGVVGVALTVVNQDAKTAMKATLDVIWRRDSDAAAASADEPELAHALDCVPL